MSFGGGENGDHGQMSLQAFFGVESGKVLEERITQLGMGIPKLDNDLSKMQHEIQILVERYTEVNKLVLG